MSPKSAIIFPRDSNSSKRFNTSELEYLRLSPLATESLKHSHLFDQIYSCLKELFE
jgi:hypothetical protein